MSSPANEIGRTVISRGLNLGQTTNDSRAVQRDQRQGPAGIMNDVSELVQIEALETAIFVAEVAGHR
jgi:hypothetical protein